MRTILVTGQYNRSSFFFLLCLFTCGGRQHLLYVVVVVRGHVVEKKKAAAFYHVRTYALRMILSCACNILLAYIYSAHVSCQFVVKLFGVVCARPNTKTIQSRPRILCGNEVLPRQILYVLLVPSFIDCHICST